MTLGNLGVNPYPFPTMMVDALREFAPITQVIDVHFVLVAHAGRHSARPDSAGQGHAGATEMAVGVSGTKPEQFAACIRDDSATSAKLIREAGTKAD